MISLFLSLLDMLLVIPLMTIEMIQCHLLPVNRNGLSCAQVSNSWHLEWEESLVHAHSFELVESLWIATRLVNLDDVVVCKELSVEATDNHYLIMRKLTHTSTLSSRERTIWILNR